MGKGGGGEIRATVFHSLPGVRGCKSKIVRWGVGLGIGGLGLTLELGDQPPDPLTVPEVGLSNREVGSPK